MTVSVRIPAGNVRRMVRSRSMRLLLFGDRSSWEALRREAGDVERVVGISRVAFRMPHAMLYIEDVADGDGSGTLILLENVGGTWIQREANSLWIT